MSWGVWLALALGLANVAVWALVVVGVRSVVRRYKPVVAPLVQGLAGIGVGVSVELEHERELLVEDLPERVGEYTDA